MRDEYEPINFMGQMCHDPRDEVRARAQLAWQQGDKMVAIPISLARFLADLRECDDTTVISDDEDGPLIPMTVRCKKVRGHPIHHSNGFTSWSEIKPLPDTGWVDLGH
jgi:hypothetical protein